MTICRSRIWWVILAGALAAPAQLPAQLQQDTVRTHVVRRGDTLWGLAVTYLGSGPRWREILALNRGVVQAADSLPVGATLRIPGAATVPVRPADPAPPTARPDPSPVPARPESARVRPAPGAAEPPARERTIFFGAQPGGGFVPVVRDSSGMRAATDTTRSTPAAVYEVLSAPYVVAPEILERAGSCVRLGRGEAAVQGATPGGALLHTTMTVVPPASSPAREGERLILIRPVALLPGLGRVVVPTGVVRLSGTSSPRDAEIVAQFEVIACTDAVVPAMDLSPPPATPPAAISSGPTGRVVWVDGDALLPSLQHAVIVDLGSAAGVRPGDVVSILAGDDSTVVAAASIVRVDGLTSSAMIVRRPQAGIVAGLSARVTGKVP
jgi:hypothetical protein